MRGLDNVIKALTLIWQFGVAAALVAVVILTIPVVFGQLRMGNYRMSDFDDDDKPGKMPK